MQQNKHIKASSRCGLDCLVCPAYITTASNDDCLREKTAGQWNERYNATGRQPITKEEINCLSCLSPIEPIYKHCHECGVRLCGIEKDVQNCGDCLEYPTCQ